MEPTQESQRTNEDLAAQAKAEPKPARETFRKRASKKVVWPVWIRVSPFFLSAFFFLSVFFALFSPLPLLLLSLKSGRGKAILASASNAGLVFFLAGPVSCVAFLVFVATLSLVLSECLRRRKSIEKSVAYTLLAMGSVGTVFLLAHSQYHHVAPWVAVQQESKAIVDYLAENMSKDVRSGLSTGADLDEWKQNLVLEFPSAIAVFSLVLVWANLILALRINAGGSREKLKLKPTFFRDWKAPEFLVWPTIIAGGFLLFGSGIASALALNLLKFLMAIYVIQGLCLMSFFFDIWQIRGMFRSLLYLLGIFLMMPLLLGLGFFDLWFDFRAKFRQS